MIRPDNLSEQEDIMSIDNMRSHVENAYDSDSWKRKVRLMPDNQVIAIYKSLLNRGQLEKKKPKKKPPTYEQLCMF